ncbi:MAG: M14 family metallopeptidase, partial [Bdellovibrionota bacterium]
QAHVNISTDLTWMKVKASTKEDRTKIHNLGVTIESVQADYVTVLARPADKVKLEKMGIVDVSFPFSPDLMDFPDKDSKFHNYQEVVTAIDTLKNTNKDIVQVETIGKSVEGRDIINIKITATPENEINLPAIVFMGTHHAREHVSTEVPLMLAQYLVEQYNLGNKTIQNLLQTRIVHIIPMVNPDGVEWDISSGSYKMWRKNRIKNNDGTMGVDLNRNYGYKWGGEGSSNDPGSDIYRGPAPFSEPETQAIKNFVENRKNITTLLSFHTYSKLILYPWGHKYDSIQDEADRKVHETMGKTMAQWNGYTPQNSSELYITSGDTTDWSYGEHKIISFTFELDPENMFEGGFYPGQAIIDSVFQKNLQPAMYLIENTDNPYKVLEPQHKSLGFNTPIF